MDNTTKQHIADELRKYLSTFDSQNKGAASLTNVSVATISHMINGKWEKISDEKWNTVAKQLNIVNDDWVINTEATSFVDLTQIYADAAQYANVLAPIGKASCGKDVAAKAFKESHRNVILVSCKKKFSPRLFLREILFAIGAINIPFSAYDMEARIVKSVLATKNPLIILNEADKLNDNCICEFITLYNSLENKCGIVLQATPHLEEKFRRGLDRGRIGYAEAFSRLGAKFIHILEDSRKDYERLIRINGITDPNAIASIYNDCNNDKRRVRRLVHAEKMKGAVHAAA